MATYISRSSWAGLSLCVLGAIASIALITIVTYVGLGRFGPHPLPYGDRAVFDYTSGLPASVRASLHRRRDCRYALQAFGKNGWIGPSSSLHRGISAFCALDGRRGLCLAACLLAGEERDLTIGSSDRGPHLR
jgi:hypothetical protein